MVSSIVKTLRTSSLFKKSIIFPEFRANWRVKIDEENDPHPFYTVCAFFL